MTLPSYGASTFAPSGDAPAPPSASSEFFPVPGAEDDDEHARKATLRKIDENFAIATPRKVRGKYLAIILELAISGSEGRSNRRLPGGRLGSCGNPTGIGTSHPLALVYRAALADDFD